MHHVGILVGDIPAATARYVRTFGYRVLSKVTHDPFQTAFVQFLGLPGDTALVEFVGPDGEKSKLANALSKGGGLNHLCFRTTDIDATCRQLRAQGLFLLQPPVPAVALSGRIAWFMGADGIPIEFVELDRAAIL